MADATSRVRFWNTDGTAEWATLATAGIVPTNNLDILVNSKVNVISSADILLSNTQPISILAPSGANKIYVINSVTVKFTYGTTPYATNTNLQIKHSTSTTPIVTIDLTTADSNYRVLYPTGSILVYPNDSLHAQTQTGNPTAGDSPLDLWVSYYILDVS